MKVASNSVKDVVAFFREKLSGLYDAGELEEVIYLVFNKYTGFSKTDLQLRLNDNLNQSELLKVYDACKALSENIPVQYVLNEAWFYDRAFYVNPSVLIPRPETEELVELILKTTASDTKTVLDIGTGSGCIPILLAAKRPEWKVSGLDVSEPALQTAKGNAVRHQVTIHWLQADVLNATCKALLGTYDLIVSNPPYIKREEADTMHERVKQQEPSLALFVEDADATVFYKRIIDLCGKHLNKGGDLFFELNPLTADSVKQYALQSERFSHAELINDMSGKCRFLKAKRM